MSILGKSILLFLISISMISCSRIEAPAKYDPSQYYAPVPHMPSEKKSTLDLPESKLTNANLEIISQPGPATIRILIFPHIGSYSQPQGKETVLNRLMVQATSGQCQLNNVQTGATILQAATLEIKTETISSPMWIDCDKTAKIIRDTGLPVIEYRGRIMVKVGKLKTGEEYLRMILHLPFEEYLRGVVPAEMPSSWDSEALKAQAVAARTYALYQITQSGPANPDYDFDDTVMYQAFLGVNRENTRTDEAIRLTDSQILTYDQKPIQAFFSADSGGFTESAENVWKKVFPYCPSKPEVYDLHLVNNDWKYSATLEKTEGELRQAGLIKGSATLTDFNITQKSISGRAIEISLSFSDGQIKKYFGPDVQMAIRLKSNFMTVSKDQQGLLNFEGKGYGHGVGMNQWGAKILAEFNNWDYRQILSFYFSK